MKIKYLAEQLLSVPDTWNKGTETLVLDNILYIKGTDDPVDWLKNFMIGNDYYHFGFHSEAVMLSHPLENRALKLIVGHSAGAAIGHLIGYYLGLPSVGFGCPNFFSRYHLPKMANHLDDFSVNFDLDMDVFCKVPCWFSKGSFTINGTSHIPFEHSIAKYKKVFEKYHLFLVDGRPVVKEI